LRYHENPFLNAHYSYSHSREWLDQPSRVNQFV
jgi:hypothetical protein